MLSNVMCCKWLWIVQLVINRVLTASSTTSTGIGNVRIAPSLSGMSPRFNRFSNFVLNAQQQIITTLEKEDGKEVFVQDPWTKQSRDDGPVEGHGITAVIQRGDLLEKGAVSTTIITGRLTEERAKAISSRSGNPDIVVGKSYAAAALSLVLHSKNPMVSKPCFPLTNSVYPLLTGILCHPLSLISQGAYVPFGHTIFRNH